MPFSWEPPADGAVLESAPDQVTLRFNEPVRVISLRLVDEVVKRRPSHQALKARRIEWRRRCRPLSPGSYVVSWRLLSDGHRSAARLYFALGTAQRHVDPGGMVGRPRRRRGFAWRTWSPGP